MNIMSRKKKFILGGLAVLVLYGLLALTTGGINIYLGRDYTLESTQSHGNVDHPEVWQGKWIEKRRFQIPYALRLYTVQPSLDVDLHLETLDAEHEPREPAKLYRSFTVESLRIAYDDGTSFTLISAQTPLEKRTFKPLAWPQETHVKFHQVLTRQADFSTELKGYTTKLTGQVIPFSSSDRYRYERVRDVTTEWYEQSIRNMME